jgi:hypothetical protein
VAVRFLPGVTHHCIGYRLRGPVEVRVREDYGVVLAARLALDPSASAHRPLSHGPTHPDRTCG